MTTETKHSAYRLGAPPPARRWPTSFSFSPPPSTPPPQRPPSRARRPCFTEAAMVAIPIPPPTSKSKISPRTQRRPTTVQSMLYGTRLQLNPLQRIHRHPVRVQRPVQVRRVRPPRRSQVTDHVAFLHHRPFRHR